MFFNAVDSTNGNELRWIDTSVPSPAVNTIAIATAALDANPGLYGGIQLVGTKLFFTAFDSLEGYELRWIDSAVSVPVVNTISVAAGVIDSYAGRNGGFNLIGSGLYFTAQNAAFNTDLRWIDTSLAVPPIHTIAISENSASSYAGSSKETVGDKLYFTATDPQFGSELRWIDTSVSLTAVSTLDINAGAASSAVGNFGGFIAFGSKLYFMAQDNAFGAELRWIDTSLETPILNTVDVVNGVDSSYAGYSGRIAVGNKLFFTVSDPANGSGMRWIDMTLANPVINTINFSSGTTGANPGTYGGFTVVGSKLYFTAFDALNGYELRWIDTALASPVLNTISINPGTASAFSINRPTAYSDGLQAVGTKLYFSAFDPIEGEELRWIDTTLAVPVVNTISIAAGATGASPAAGEALLQLVRNCSSTLMKTPLVSNLAGSIPRWRIQSLILLM